MKLYHFLVNKHAGIRERYHKVHDGALGLSRFLSWGYLLWLNFCYYILGCHFLGKSPKSDFYEGKRLLSSESESRQDRKDYPWLTVEEYVEKLKKYDIISFDIFDTLIFRPLSEPADVFYFVGEKLGILDFKNIRMSAERDARIRCQNQRGHMEVTLAEIWEVLEETAGLDSERGAELEKETEWELCYGNPFMKEVWQRLRNLGKRLIVVSDMYLPEEFLTALLCREGFLGAKKRYVSCEYRKNKASGNLFQLVKEELTAVSRDLKKPAALIHVGDNPHSDVGMAEKSGFAALLYPNINRNSLLYRPYDMSALVGSAYRGLINNRLYNGLGSYSLEYEYGYLYGGLFAVGYCNFIHDYCRKNHIDRILFLSRDGDILKRVYELLFPGESAAYAYWSRKAATKLMADFDKNDYFRRFVYHKVNQDYTIQEILHAMELDELTEELAEEKNDGEVLSEVRLKPSDRLTDRNAYFLRRFVEANWNRVLAVYQPQQEGAKAYYEKLLSGCGSAAAVDIGWAGSGALALRYLAEQSWKLPCRITGLVAGTNTVHNGEPDASEPFLQSGKLAAYLYSQSHNRDLWKKHDPGKGYNIFWELLLSSPEPQFQGFGQAMDGSLSLRFGKYDENPKGIREIRQGILDFAEDYQCRFRSFPYMLGIGGRDAYAPMLLGASHQEKYLKEIAKRFSLEVNVD